MADKTGYTEESPGVKSGTRLIVISAAYAVIAMSLYMCYCKLDPLQIGGFFSSGMASLGALKWMGTRNESQGENKQ